MTDTEATTEPAVEEAPWRSRAVARSLDGARSRAEERVQRFLDAAVELIAEKGGLDFTVQDVVERSNQSLRSFYQFFDGKQHLLLAVYEESMHSAAQRLAETLSDESDPLERVHKFVVTLYEWSEREPVDEPPAPHLTVRAMADFVFGLLASNRDQAAAASAPLYEVLLGLLNDANDAGALSITDTRRTAALVLQTTMFNAFGTVTHGGEDAHHSRAEQMWEFCFHGLSGNI